MALTEQYNNQMEIGKQQIEKGNLKRNIFFVVVTHRRRYDRHSKSSVVRVFALQQYIQHFNEHNININYIYNTFIFM